MGRKSLSESQKKLNKIIRTIKESPEDRTVWEKIFVLIDERPDDYHLLALEIVETLGNDFSHYDDYDQFLIGALFGPNYRPYFQPILVEAGILK